MILFHVTCKSKLGSIAKDGLKECSYWASDEEVSDYYAETIKDEGEEPVILQVTLSDLDASQLRPDQPGIDEPITMAIGMSEDEVARVWRSSKKTWKDSIEIISSLRYDGWIEPGKLCVIVGDDAVLLSDFIQSVTPVEPALVSRFPISGVKIRHESIKFEVHRDDDDEGVFVSARDTNKKNDLGEPLDIAHLHVPDESVRSNGDFSIGDIYVSEDLRRQGIASTMVKLMCLELGGAPLGATSVFSDDGKSFFDAYKSAQPAPETNPTKRPRP